MKFLRSALPLLLVGCVAMNLPLSVVVKEADGKKMAVQIMGDEVSVHHIREIVDALNYLPIQMLEVRPAFHIRDDGHMGNAAAHQCLPPFRKICIKPLWVNHINVWHECMHVYEDTSDSRANHLVKKWVEIAGDVYHENYAPGWGVSEGLVTEYSRRGANEDRAEFFSLCMAVVCLNQQWRLTGNPHFKTDKRYRQKLELFRATDIFTDEQYQKLKLLFE